MSQQSWPIARQRGRWRWWPAIWAAVIAFTIVVTAGAVLLSARVVDDASDPAPPGDSTSDRVSNLGATSRPSPTSAAPDAPTSRLVLIGPRRVVDSRPDDPLPPGAQVQVPLPGLPPDSTAVLLEVSVLNSTGAGDVTLLTAGEETSALRVSGKRAQSSATVVARLGADREVTARIAGGGDLVVTLTGAFKPAAAARAGRILAVPAQEALVLVPERDGNQATIRPEELGAVGVQPGEVSALLLSFRADVGVNGGTVAIGRSWDQLDQQIHWSATKSSDRTRFGFLVVPLSDQLRLYYHAGTRLAVDVVGLVTGKAAAKESAGLSVPVTPEPLPAVTLPAGGRADVDLPEAGEAKAALVTTDTTPQGERPRAVLGLLDVRAGAVRVNGPEQAEITLTPQLLIN